MINEEIFNYQREMYNLSSAINKLATAFDVILKEYCKLHKNKYEGKEYQEYFDNCFSNPDERARIMSVGIKELIDAGYPVEEAYEDYVKHDKKIAEIQDIILKKLEEYETACKNISNQENVSTKDIEEYFKCISECYQNYLKYGFEDEFSFKSAEMRNSVHSFETQNGRKEIDVDLSIPHDKVLHLMELPNPAATNNVFSDLYNTFCNEYPEIISEIEEKINDKKDIDIKKYIYFLNYYASQYINYIISDMTIEKEKDKTIVNGLLKKYTKEEILSEMSKSFQKSINFRKVYEYKIIPEIVLDYEYTGKSESSENRYIYRRGSSAFTELGIKNSRNITELVNMNSSFDELSMKDDVKLTEEEIEVIKNIIKNFGNNPNIRIAWKDGKIHKEGGSSRIKIGDRQYKYYYNSKEIKSDLPPNVFLVSYDDNEMLYESIISDNCILQAIMILSYTIAKDLKSIGLEYNKDIETKDASVFFKDISSFIKRIIEVRERGMVLSNDKSLSESLKEAEKNLIDSKRHHLINTDLISQYINNFLKDENSIKNFESQLRENFKDFKSELDKNIKSFIKDNTDSSEMMGLTNIIKSYFVNNLATHHSREDFGIVSYGGDIKTSDWKEMIEDKETGKKVKVPKDAEIVFSMVMKLAQSLKERYEEQIGKDPARFDTSVGVIGFAVDRYDYGEQVEGKTVREKYAKTFMGKTALQVISDLRINGWAYKLDCIYGENNGRKVFYNIIPLVKYSPKSLTIGREAIEEKNYSIGRGR